MEERGEKEGLSWRDGGSGDRKGTVVLGRRKKGGGKEEALRYIVRVAALERSPI